MKSLFLGFLRAPRGHQREALPPLAAVLEFSPTETQEAAFAIQTGEAGIIGGIANKLGGIVSHARGRLSISQSIYQSIDQSINHSINQPFSHSSQGATWQCHD